MKKEIKTIYKTMAGLVLTMALPLSFVTGTLADETSDTSETTTASEETTAETSEETMEPEDLTGKSFENIYGTQIYSFLNHKYVFDGEEIPLVKSNFFFVNSYLDLCQYAAYGYYPANSEGYFDLAAECNSGEYKTYGDLYISYAEKTLENTLIMNKLAKEEGVILSFEYAQKIEDTLSGIDKKAKNANVTSEEYLKIYFGPDCTKENFKETLESFYIADQYTQHYCENYQFTDEEKLAPEVRYALFYAPEDSATADEKAAAEKNATDTKNNSDSLDKLKTLGQEAVTAGTCLESNDIHVVKGQTVSAFENWALDPARKEGDIDIIYASEYGYFVVGYLGMTPQTEDYLNNIAMTKLSEQIKADIEAGKYQFETKDAYVPAITTVPTATPAETTPSSDESGVLTLPTDPDATFAPDGTTPASDNGPWTPTNIIVVILASVGGVALISAIIILVVQFVRNGNSKKEDDTEEKEEKKSKAKKVVEEVEDIEEDKESDVPEEE
ncbi:MAG: hypothetical protein J5778_04145 [Clostridiales bacterium]|nr:hypothetical protein [Clostridiales bacterium]